MRASALIVPLCAALMASACATPPVAGEPAGQCDVAAARAYVGQSATATVTEQARTAAGADIVRVLDEDAVITMEYRRLNLIVNKARVITSANCS